MVCLVTDAEVHTETLIYPQSTRAQSLSPHAAHTRKNRKSGLKISHHYGFLGLLLHKAVPQLTLVLGCGLVKVRLCFGFLIIMGSPAFCSTKSCAAVHALHSLRAGPPTKQGISRDKAGDAHFIRSCSHESGVT